MSTPTITADLRPVGQRFERTATGIEIGCAHQRAPRADVAGSVAGPFRPPTTLADRAVGFMCGLGAATVLALLVAERLA